MIKTKEQFAGWYAWQKNKNRIERLALKRYSQKHPEARDVHAVRNRESFMEHVAILRQTDRKYQYMLSEEFMESEEFTGVYARYEERTRKALDDNGSKARKLRQDQEKYDNFHAEWDEWCTNVLRSSLETAANQAVSINIDRISSYLRTKALNIRRRHTTDRLNALNIDEFIDITTELISSYSLDVLRYESYEMSIYEALLQTGSNGSRIRNFIKSSRDEAIDTDVFGEIYAACGEANDAYGSHRRLVEYFSRERILELMRRNSRYKKVFSEYDEKQRLLRLMHREILETIPEDVTELFPFARSMNRHFILHIGPTNSGKTYEALKALKAAGQGMYLAPLRLMAYEAFETLNNDGVPCRMVTGEERIDNAGARITAMTIELMDPYAECETIVIDEAQMIADRSRGGAWTNAILGAAAREVHVCMAPEAEEIVTRLIELCGDTYETRRYYRKTRLLPDMGSFTFPDSVRPGDALILFSRYKVTACAASLQQMGIRTSMVYGALPYEARHEEVRRFASGETSVLVATDAIGMGMNIPIRRIVFLETVKFDGQETRQLTGTEIKQIAGRAGRFGIYDTGYYTSEYDEDIVRQRFEGTDLPIRQAVLGFPRRLVSVQGSLTDIIGRWKEIIPGELFVKSDIDEMLLLARLCEDYTDDKELIYELMTIPVETDNEYLMELYTELMETVAGGGDLGVWSYYAHSDLMPDGLEELEQEYKRLDLIYNFLRKFADGEGTVDIIERKRLISDRITWILAAQQIKGKTCRSCGRPLPWNYPYGVCSSCHSKKRSRNSRSDRKRMYRH